MIMGKTAPSQISDSLNKRIAREFRKPFFQDWDRRFIFILMISLTIEIFTISLLSSTPVTGYSEREIARLQKRFASVILGDTDQPLGNAMVASTQTSTPADEEDGSGESDSEEGSREGEGSGDDSGEGRDDSGSGSEGTVEPRRPTRTEAAELRRRNREAISEQVSNRGLLGLLTGTGTAAEGQAVQDMFSGPDGGGVGQDLDKVLASVDGLSTSGTSGLGSEGSGEGVRGGRSGSNANIDDLVTDLGSAHSQSLSRKGELLIETPEGEEGRGLKSAHRNSEAIQAVLYKHVNAIRYCYERELKRNPNLKGKITVRITIAPNGHVTEVTIVSSTLNNERVERCILARIRLWKDFEPIDSADGDVTIRYSYAFGY
jgi:TonB family protein